MKHLMAITVASWLAVATTTAQTSNAPAPNSTSAPSHQAMEGMDMSQHGSHQATTPVHDMHKAINEQEAPNHVNQRLQEPENPEMHTGASLPAPELLKDVAARAPMKLAAFLQLADENNPTLKQAAAIIRRSAAQAKQAGLYPNPSVGYQGDQIRGGAYGGGEHGAYIAQSIVLGGKLSLRRDIYEEQKKSDEAAAEAQLYRVHNDVSQSFYKALSAQEIVRVRQRLLHLTLDAVETVHQLANVGQVDAPDILQSEVEAEQAKVDYTQAQREFLQDFKILATLVGKHDLPVSPLEAVLDVPPEIHTDEIVDHIAQTSPIVQQAERDVSVAEAKLKDAKRESIPDLLVKVGEQYSFETVSEIPRRSAGLQSFATVGIDVPLWNRNQGNKKMAGAEIERAQDNLQRVKLSLRQQAEPLVQMYLSSKFEADRYRTQMIPRATRAYELYLKKYQSMAAAYPQVLVSQRTLFQLQVSYIQALNNVWQSAIALQNYTLKDGLDAPTTSSTPTTLNLPYSNGSEMK
jgi:cobalt-zinc-cadmium efflux system outer membrane protein